MLYSFRLFSKNHIFYFFQRSHRRSGVARSAKRSSARLGGQPGTAQPQKVKPSTPVSEYMASDNAPLNNVTTPLSGTGGMNNSATDGISMNINPDPGSKKEDNAIK